MTITRWYAEKVGGAGVERPQFEDLRDAVRKGFVGRVLVYRLDRLSRGGIRETLAIVEEFRKYGCKIESVADGFSLDGAAADVVLAVLAWAAQMERAAIGERIRAARTRIEAKGGSWGRTRRVDEATAQRIRELSASRTVREISIALKVPRSTVGRVVSQKGAYKPTPPKRTKKAE